MEAGRELPVGWAVSPLLEAGDLIRGVTYSKKDASDLPFENSIPVLRANNIQNGSLLLDDLVHVPSDLVTEEQRIKAGDIVIATSSGSISVVGKAAQAKSDLGAGFGAFCGLVRPSSNLCASYLGHFFGTDYYRNSVSSMARGVNINNLKKSHFEELSLPLAPLNEQRRIAAKLDTTLAAVDACRQRLDGVEALLKRFRQAVLAVATSGELTREWREEMGMNEYARSVRLGDVIHEMRNGLSPKPSPTPPGAKILRIGAIRPGCVDLEDHRYLDLPMKDLETYALRVGDLIFTRYNGTLEFVGVCGLVRELGDFYIYPDKLIRVRCDSEKALSAYLEIAFSATSVRAQIESLVKSSAGQKGVSGADLKGVRFSLPSLDEQQEIIRRAEQLFSLADQLEARLTAARQIVERLTPALLAKAFRGELVPQDPNDEPASVLLERIRAARQTDAAAAKPPRRGRRKAAAGPVPDAPGAAPVPPELLVGLLSECGALSERALLAASELAPERFQRQLAKDMDAGRIREDLEDGERVLVLAG
jgi:type I restriction enzyme, S subunit